MVEVDYIKITELYMMVNGKKIKFMVLELYILLEKTLRLIILNLII